MTSRPSERTQTCGASEARVRAAQARAFLDTAELVVDADDELATPGVAAALAVLAGVAASDAACCAALGRRSRGQDHRQATTLLAQVEPHGQDLSRALGRLLTSRTGRTTAWCTCLHRGHARRSRTHDAWWRQPRQLCVADEGRAIRAQLVTVHRRWGGWRRPAGPQRRDLADLTVPPGSVDKAFAINVNLFWATSPARKLAVLDQVLQPGGILHVLYGAAGPTSADRIIGSVVAALREHGFVGVTVTTADAGVAVTARSPAGHRTTA